MFQPGKNTDELIAEFRRRPYGPHSAPLQTLLIWLRTRPRDRKLVVFRRAPGASLQLCELGGDPVELTAVSGEAYATLEEAECAAFDLRWREACRDTSRPASDAS